MALALGDADGCAALSHCPARTALRVSPRAVQRNRDAVLIKITQRDLCSKCNIRRSVGGGLRPTDVPEVLAGRNYLAPWAEITLRVSEVLWSLRILGPSYHSFSQCPWVLSVIQGPVVS